MKRFLLALISAIALVGGGAALAQSHGGAMHSGGNGWHGGGNGWHGGSGWHHSGGHGGSHFGVFVGFPAFYWGGYYPYSYYPYYGYPYYGYPAYYPAPVYADPGPTTYIEQDDDGVTQAPAPGGSYSYYCTDPAGYYPQVQNCAKGWLRVVPDAGPAPRPR